MAKKYVIACYDEKSMKNLEQIEKQMEYLKQTENRMQKYANVSCCFEMYVNDKVSNVITKIEERVIKLTQTPYQIKIIANTGGAGL